MKAEDVVAGKTYRIRTWDSMLEEFGYEPADSSTDEYALGIDTPHYFATEMKHLCGTTVVSLFSGSINVCSSDDELWSIDCGMLEEV
jgi:hypothetical protein